MVELFSTPKILSPIFEYSWNNYIMPFLHSRIFEGKGCKFYLPPPNASKNQSTDALIKIINTNIATIVRRYLEAVRRKADIQTKFNHRYRQKDYYFFIKEFLFSCHKFSFNHQYIRISLNLFFLQISPIY